MTKWHSPCQEHIFVGLIVMTSNLDFHKSTVRKLYIGDTTATLPASVSVYLLRFDWECYRAPGDPANDVEELLERDPMTLLTRPSLPSPCHSAAAIGTSEKKAKKTPAPTSRVTWVL